MKPASIFVTAVLLVICIFIGCKKDYPEDIPEWVIEYILKQKRAGVGCDMVITEYAKGDTLLYLISKNNGQQNNITGIYDSQGFLLCTYDFAVWNCPFNVSSDLVMLRIIWKDESDVCK